MVMINDCCYVIATSTTRAGRIGGGVGGGMCGGTHSLSVGNKCGLCPSHIFDFDQNLTPSPPVQL